MEQIHFKTARRSVIAAASLALAIGGLRTGSLRAEDAKPADEKAMSMSAEDQKMAMDHLAKMKEMAADPQKAEMMTKGLADMMVMEQMSKMMAMDPEFQKSAMEAMNDPAMKKIHDDAEKMAHDPEQMKQMQQAVMADPMKMKMVEHHAMRMAMMHDKMMDKDKKTEEQK